MLHTHIQWCLVALCNPLGVSMMPRCDLQDMADNRLNPGDRTTDRAPGIGDSGFCAVLPSISRVRWCAQKRGMTSAGSDSAVDGAPLVRQWNCMEGKAEKQGMDLFSNTQ